ncbi:MULTISPECIES: TRAP transporter small permease [unclassified Aminobacter]|uniref:TRAP transporter small permease n=1 Tax=unclassified Aminobacter TaxID=2644704 RepID=UPI000467A92E|nr:MULTISPECIES: TRAP transporter small permease [unclassified Aminobacter]TWG63111.1 TRAP-type C4-dicarboxylate transport system permease small subunit [Aminobacter sp. J44]TWH34970.1 TRAP-type C4-dicarboxylate transport system permease small subunit [Aminobacter sp. J15]
MRIEQNTAAPLLTKVNTLALYLAGFGLVVMTGMVAWQVFCRYVLNDSPSWTEPGAVMLMSWFIFLGAAVGVRENNHLGFDVLLYMLPPSAKKWLRMISDLVIFAFGIGMVWYGIGLVRLTANTTMPALGISGGWDYAPLVVGGVLVILFALERIVLRVRGRPVDEVLDDIAPSEVAVELENIDDVRGDAAGLAPDGGLATARRD